MLFKVFFILAAALAILKFGSETILTFSSLFSSDSKSSHTHTSAASFDAHEHAVAESHRQAAEMHRHAHDQAVTDHMHAVDTHQHMTDMHISDHLEAMNTAMDHSFLNSMPPEPPFMGGMNMF